MRIFLTGATGYLGSDLVRELADAGHQVRGLTRNREKAARIASLGGEAVVGHVQDPASYRGEAEAADAIVHMAAEDSAERAAVDRVAVDTLISAATSGRPGVLVYTSGCFVLGDTGDEPAHEDASTAGAPPYVAWRPPHERMVLDAGGPGLATAVIRPGMVYGGDGGTFRMLFDSARQEGAARYVGSGTNRWSPVYRGDVSRLYRMVLEEAAVGIFHCAERAARVRDVAEAASHAAGAGGATASQAVEEAREELGGFADALTLDQVMGCGAARRLGWEPAHRPFRESAAAVYEELLSRSPSGS